MSEEQTRSRSPNSPKISLGEALPHVEALYKKAGRSPLKAEIAATALGYNGITGSSASLLGALNQYGLIDRTKGDVQVTPLALRIIVPVSPEDKIKALRDAALTPKSFYDIHEKYAEASEDVLANQLVHEGFALDVAKRVASAYKANVELAKLGQLSVTSTQPSDAPKSDNTAPSLSLSESAKPANSGHGFQALIAPAAPKNMIASFKIPLPLAEAEFIFTGDKLEAEDFDALIDYIELFKKQYMRKQALLKPANEQAIEKFLEEGKRGDPN